MSATKRNSALILELAARPQGVTIREVECMTPKQYSATTHVLLRAGKLCVWKISHRLVRYFTTVEQRAAFSGQVVSRQLRTERTPMPGVTINAGNRLAFRRDAEVVIPPNVKITICPSPAQRFTALGHTLPIQRGRVPQEA